jgi:hypothetical protein
MTKEFDAHTVNCKLVGVMVPQPIAEYLTLYGLLKGKTKSNVVRTMIHCGYTELHKNLSQKQLISALTKVYQKEWGGLKKGKGFTDVQIEEKFTLFQYDLVNKLLYKSLPETTIDQIVTKIKM